MKNNEKQSFFTFDEEFIESLRKINIDSGEDIQSLYLSLDRKLNDNEKKKQASKENFKQIFNSIWGDLLKYLNRSSDIFKAVITFAEKSNHGLEVNSVKYEVICRIIARSLQIFDEILILLNNGYPNGAMARWRTLYELQIVLQYLAVSNEDLLYHMYYEHGTYCEYKLELAKRKEFETQKISKMTYTDEAFEQLEKIAKEIEEKYDTKKFKKNYGWAYQKLARYTFEDIEKEVDSEQLLRSYYKDSCDAVHSSSRGTFKNMAIFESPNLIHSGSSIYGISIPAQLANISLHNILHAYCCIFQFNLMDKILWFTDSNMNTVNFLIDQIQSLIESEILSDET